MEKKLNILAISYGRNLFDADNNERRRMELCAGSVSAYHMIVFTFARDSFIKTQGKNGLVLHPTNSSTKIGMLFDAVRIGKTILENKTDRWVITAQDPFEAGLVGYILSRRTKTPLNVQEHGENLASTHWRNERLLNRVRRWFGVWLVRRADSVRVVSERIVQSMVKLGVSKEKIFKVVVRIDEDEAQKNNPSTDVRAQFPEGALIVLTMARLVPQKNLPMLINAFAVVRKEVSQAHLVIVGKGHLEAELRALAQSLGIHDSVTLLPWTDTPRAFMQSADVYALTSNYEGWGRVLVEAMSVGLPGVTTDVGCAGEVFIDKRHGLVVPVGDSEAFASALKTLLIDSELRKQYGANAKRDASLTAVSTEAYAHAWRAVLERTE